MAKRMMIPVRGLGSAVSPPSVSDLAAWAGERAGIGGDLVTYYLTETLRPQKEIDLPAAGGWFYHERAAAACLPDAPADDILEDIRTVLSMKRDCWWSLPSAAAPCDDPDEDQVMAYRQVLRMMRDAGVYGHVILSAQVPTSLELELINGRRAFWYLPVPTEQGLEKVLEVQRDIAVPPSRLPLLQELMGSYSVRKVIVVDAGEADLRQALELVDADNIMTGGFAPAENRTRYWSALVAGSYIPR